MKKKQRYTYIHVIVIGIIVCLGIFALFSFFKLKSKLNERKAEYAELQEKRDAVTIQNNRLELLSQYRGTEEFAKYYARYKLGYAYPDEIIFDK